MGVVWRKAPFVLRHHPAVLAAVIVLSALVALADVAADGTACLVATHDATAATHADRVWHITDGRVR